MSDAVRLPSVRRFVHATPGAWSLLVAAFGFEELVVYGEGDTVEHAELTWVPGGGVMLGSMPAAGTAHERISKTGTSSIYVLTDAPCARATVAAPLVCDLHDTAYGSRDFATRAPRARCGRLAPTAANRDRRGHAAKARELRLA